MTTASSAATGSANRWGPLWGARPDDWALERGPARPQLRGTRSSASGSTGRRVLDVGCGVRRLPPSGRRARRRAARDRRVRGADRVRTDATARRRSPRRRDGDLPWDDDTFDLVTGFNSFFFANDMVAALREAGRVAKPGAPVVIQVWGAHERCDLEAMKQIARPFLPPRPPDAPPDPDLSQPGVLEALATRPASRRRASSTPPGLRVPGRGERSAAPSSPSPASPSSSAPTASTSSRRRSSTASRPTAQTDGSYRLSNEYHYLIARA